MAMNYHSSIALIGLVRILGIIVSFRSHDYLRLSFCNVISSSLYMAGFYGYESNGDECNAANKSTIMIYLNPKRTEKLKKKHTHTNATPLSTLYTTMDLLF